MLPSGPRDEGAAFGSFEFKEVFDEEVGLQAFYLTREMPVEDRGSSLNVIS